MAPSFASKLSLALLAPQSECTLDSFNTTLQGRVQPLTPFSLPCFSNYNGKAVQPNDAACHEVQANYSSPWLRTNSPNGYMNNQDEMCSSDPSDQCLLDSNDPTDPLAYENGNCRQGNMPSYYFEVKDANDVVEAFKYSSCSGTRLSIKNSGHDYLGRSSGKGTLSLWMRNLRSMSYDAAFVPSSCSTRYNAITVGAGINFDEVYAFADKHNVTILGGYSSTVGASGGWVQMGGHSILSPVYGLGIDRVIQYKVVTLMANTELPMNVRILISSGPCVEVVEISFVAANIEFPSTSSNVLPFLDIVVNNTLKWAKEGWGGHITGNTLVNVSPLLSVDEAKKSLAQAIAYAKAQGGSATIEQFSSWYPFYKKYVTSSSVSVGVTHFAGSRLVPKAIFETAQGRKNLMDFFKLIQSVGQTPYIPVVGPVLKNYTEGSTSATPAWRSAIWERGSGAAWVWNSTLETREQKVASIQNMTATLERITPNSGAYSNEANAFTEWQNAWWGENYEKLVDIKSKYDPHGLLSCWKCVGWKDSQANSTCFAAFT